MRCLVVGGARRLGAALAAELAAAGADVAVSTRTPSAAATVVACIEQLGRRALVVGGDVSSRLEARHIVRTATTALDGLDLVVFAASGPFRPAPPEAVDDVAWSSSMDVIARGFLFCAQAAREVFLEQAGRSASASETPAAGATAEAESPAAEAFPPAEHLGTVVALTDIVEGALWPRLAPHYAAKAAEIMLVRLLGKAWAADGVRVCGVAPGPVDLPDDDRREASERAVRRLAYRRMLTPLEVAAAVLECTRDPAAAGQNRVVRAK
jgi:NAD(P)-dependent dehydrogenase (short-subunit alcohol dehydrogenase family)